MYSFNRKKYDKKEQEEEGLVPFRQDEVIPSVQSFQTSCLRNRTNWSSPEAVYRFENARFDKEKMKQAMETHSPKLYYLLEHIRQLDAQDIRSGKMLQKHFIFTNLQSSDYGAKMIASGLLAYGYKLGFGRMPNGDLRYKTLAELEKTAYNNFFLLTSTPLYDKPMKTKDKQKMLQLYNARPHLFFENEQGNGSRINNVYGKYIRFIILDSEFKEGIDLLDVKYVHLFEPANLPSDTTQIIGRATRAYGQCGLSMNPRVGWPLYVFIYDVVIPDALQSSFMNASTLSELYQNLQRQSSGIDLRLAVLARQIQNLTIFGSIDYPLNQLLHSEEDTDDVEEDVDEKKGGTSKKQLSLKKKVKKLSLKKKNKNPPLTPFLEKTNLTFQKSRDLIQTHFSSYAWTESDLNSTCEHRPVLKPRLIRYPYLAGQIQDEDDDELVSKTISIHGGNSSSSSSSVSRSSLKCGSLLSLNPTQRFIPAYFVPSNPIKGMLLWHGTGTGKTCIAVATATAGFEQEKYTILWVTRSSLKSDFYKNMFDQSCHQALRKKLASCQWNMPADMEDRLKLLSSSWQIPPLSYKQFTNLIRRKNKFHDQLVKINGQEDPLRKTLLIIDEAHKLYSKNDLIHQEMPDLKELKAAIHHSYQVSGSQSVRLLLMSATPMGESGLELIQLLNLCKDPSEQIPETLENFATQYLNDSTGAFTSRGKTQYLNDIAGMVSYLNRESDKQLFAQPIIEHIHVPLLEDPLILLEKSPEENRRIWNQQQQQKTLQLEKLQHQLQTIVDHIQYYDATFFQSKLKGCDVHFTILTMRQKCHRVVDQHVSQILETIRPFFSKYRLLLDRVLYEKKRFQERQLMEDKLWEQRIQEKKQWKESFSKSLYSVLINTCGQEQIDVSQQKSQWEMHPQILKLNENIQWNQDEKIELEKQWEEIHQALEEENIPRIRNSLVQQQQYVEGLLQKIDQDKRNHLAQKKEWLQKLQQNWLQKAQTVFNAQKRTRKRRLKGSQGGRLNPRDSLILTRKRLARARLLENRLLGGSKTQERAKRLQQLHMTDDIDILVAQLTNERVEQVLNDVDQYIKKLLRHHILTINEELR